VKADDKSKTYGNLNPALTAMVAGTVNGDTLNYTLATAALQFSNVGTYAITITPGSNPNYAITPTNGTLTIEARPATVKADDKSKTYGNLNPALTAMVAGTVNGDTLNYTLATAALQFSNVGTYGITVTLGSNPNYAITPTNGTLTIDKANQTITWANPANITLGTPLSSTQLNASVAGVPGGSLPCALTYTPAAGTVLSVGANQALKVDAAATTNYNTATKTVYINVNYSFVGFLPPIDNLPVINSVKAGQTVPVKWQLKDAAGNLISDLGSLAPGGLTSVKVNCSSGLVDAIEEVLLSPGSTVFRFDGTQFIFNWQTSKSWIGTCRLMTVTLKDGTQYPAQFTFK
jgi:hypothetical protein